MFSNLTIKQKLLWGVFLVSLVAASLDTLLTYRSQKKDILDGIDASLKATAYGVSHVISPGFHAAIKDQGSVSPQQHLKNMNNLRQYVQQTGIRYAYTCMQFGDRIRFTSGTDDPFFEPYDTAPDSLRKSFVDGKMRYDQYTDKYGTFRSVFVPFKTGNGKTYVVGADISMSSLQDKLWKTALLSASFEVLVFLILFMGIYVTTSRAVKPLSELTGYTKSLMEQDFKWEEEVRNQIKSICEKRPGEVGKLAEALMQMEKMLRTYIANLTETTAAKQRIESELSIARNIQMGFLPRVFPAFPGRTEFDLHAIIEPAKEVGGDLYDYFLIDERHLFFLIGDVSDKGVPAALFMAVAKTLFKTHAFLGNAKVSEIMGRVNQELSRANPWQMFVTAFAGILDVDTGEVIYCDGGHEPPFILRPGEEAEVLKKKGGPALCFLDDSCYECDTIQLQPGDSLVLYTDGVTEAMNRERRLFSQKGILQAVQSGYGESTPPVTIAQQLLEHVRLFAGGVPQSDDIAILAISYYGTKGKRA